MSELKRSRTESEPNMTLDFKNSREYTLVSDFNAKGEYLLTSPSSSTPTNYTMDKKRRGNTPNNDSDTKVKTQKKLEKENIILAEGMKKVITPS
jgi:hypothetical protein